MDTTQEDVREGAASDDVRVTGQHDPSELIRRAAAQQDKQADTLNETEQEDATEWLLGAFDDPPAVTNTLSVNVGGIGSHRREILWEIKAIPGPMIRKIRDQAEMLVRRQGPNPSGMGSAGFNANVRIVIEGTTSPDIRQVAKRRNVVDAADVLMMALENKQGLIEQIAGSILTLSGYDQDDVQDALEVRAAGN